MGHLDADFCLLKISRVKFRVESMMSDLAARSVGHSNCMYIE